MKISLEIPLLIGGCPRSGTTALWSFLNSDPRFYISSEENLLNLSRKLSALLSTKERRAQKMAGRMRELSPRETLSAQSIHLYNFDSSSVWPTIREIYHHHHAHLRPSERLCIWGDKLPSYFSLLPDCRDQFQFKYIHLSRNPLDVINSMIRRTENAAKGKDWWSSITEVDQMISTWAQAYEVIERHEEDPSILHLQYEELVFNTAAAKEKIDNFLDFYGNFNFNFIDHPKAHFDRSYLTQQIIDQAGRNPRVQGYFIKHKNSYFSA